MCSTPMLVAPNFNKTFVLECDALRKCLRVLLMQEGRPLAFASNQLRDHNLGNSTYEKETMGILHVVETWRPYLIGRNFSDQD
jgi:hypothetical protein